MIEQGRVDVVGVGNAIVDVISSVEDEFLVANGLVKGAMTLVDAQRAEALYAAMPPGIEASGGSAANTMAGIASFGGTVAYIGKVSDDQLGEVFGHDLRAIGVGYDVAASPDGLPTARCLIAVTPDAERTMNTYLGISNLLEPNDVDTDLCGRAGVVYCEGYLWDVDSAKKAMVTAMEATERGGGRVSLTLSDGFCVDRHRDEFLELVDSHVDILFANTTEITSLFEVDDVDIAVAEVRGRCEIACITRSERGSLVVTADETIEVPAWSTGTVLDTTGAGDLYAAGFLFGYNAGRDLAACGRLGSLAAGEVISHLGPRPRVSLRDLATRHEL